MKWKKCNHCYGFGSIQFGYAGRTTTCPICNGLGGKYESDNENKSPPNKKGSKNSDVFGLIFLIFIGYVFIQILSNKPQNNHSSLQLSPAVPRTPNGSLNTPIPKSDQNNTKAPNRLENQQPNSIFNNPSNSFSLFGKEFIKPADKSVSQPAPKMLRVLPPEAHLRLEPDLKSLSLGTVAQGALVTVLGYAKNAETDKQWTRVQAANGVIGFIRSSLLEDQENPTTPSSDFPDDLMVIAQEANVRSAPDPNSPSLGILTEGTPVTVLGYTKNTKTGKEWTKIEMEDGTIGFIRSSLLDKLP